VFHSASIHTIAGTAYKTMHKWYSVISKCLLPFVNPIIVFLVSNYF
jgi:hypothetical protein